MSESNGNKFPMSKPGKPPCERCGDLGCLTNQAGESLGNCPVCCPEPEVQDAAPLFPPDHEFAQELFTRLSADPPCIDDFAVNLAWCKKHHSAPMLAQSAEQGERRVDYFNALDEETRVLWRERSLGVLKLASHHISRFMTPPEEPANPGAIVHPGGG